MTKISSDEYERKKKWSLKTFPFTIYHENQPGYFQATFAILTQSTFKQNFTNSLSVH